MDGERIEALQRLSAAAPVSVRRAAVDILDLREERQLEAIRELGESPEASELAWFLLQLRHDGALVGFGAAQVREIVERGPDGVEPVRHGAPTFPGD